MITTWGYGVASCLCCYSVGGFLPFNDHVINSVAASFVLFSLFFSKMCFCLHMVARAET